MARAWKTHVYHFLDVAAGVFDVGQVTVFGLEGCPRPVTWVVSTGGSGCARGPGMAFSSRGFQTIGAVLLARRYVSLQGLTLRESVGVQH